MEVKKLGRDLKKRRKILHLNQEDVAEMGGITIKTLHLIETGNGNPSLQTLNKIIDVLGLELVLQIKQLA